MQLIKTPAKINLILKITGRDKKTGYHYLESIMVPVSLYDDVYIKESKNFSVITNRISENIPTEKNIIYKIFEELKKYTCRNFPDFEVIIEKKIPTGAGLGGGSSNGAGFLMFLNDYLDLSLTIEQMTEISSNVGSDIPFFLHNQAALVKGFGEIVQPVKISPFTENIIIVHPGFSVNTKEAYEAWDKKNLTKGSKININMHRVNDARSLKDWYLCIENDFEKLILSENDVLKSIKRDLENHDSVSFMTGSGSAVVGLFNDEKSMDKSFQSLKEKYPFVEKVKMLI